MAKHLWDEGKHVRLVDMSAVTTADLAQPAHPNDTGYEKMADAFLEEIEAAAEDGWLKDAVKYGNGKPCTGNGDGGGDKPSKAGNGWRALGVIAPGMGGPAGKVEIHEINGDDRGDYVKIFPNGSVRAALNTSSRTPGKPHWVDQGIIAPGVGKPGNAVRFADMDNDGRDDYLTLGINGSVTAYLNKPGANGKPHWVNKGIILRRGFGAAPDAIRFADVNGDGRDDFVRVGEGGAVHAYLNHRGVGGTYSWEERKNWAPGVRYGSRDKLRLADVNGDDKADYLMVGNTGAVHAYINDGGGGNGGFTERLNFVKETGYPGSKSEFADISGDGKADYLVVYDGGAVRAWLNRGGNTGA